MAKIEEQNLLIMSWRDALIEDFGDCGVNIRVNPL